MIHPILSICNAHIALALLINLYEVDSVCSRSNTGVTIPAREQSETGCVAIATSKYTPPGAFLRL